MRNPIPNNRLVALTLAGALLTAIVAGGLAFPGIGLTSGSATETAEQLDAEASTANLAADAPEPNQNFTPDVKTESSYEEHEEHEEEEYEDEEHEEEEYEEEHEDEEQA